MGSKNLVVANWKCNGGAELLRGYLKAFFEVDGADVVSFRIEGISKCVHLPQDNDASENKTYHGSNEDSKGPRVLLTAFHSHWTNHSPKKPRILPSQSKLLQFLWQVGLGNEIKTVFCKGLLLCFLSNLQHHVDLLLPPTIGESRVT